MNRILPIIIKSLQNHYRAKVASIVLLVMTLLFTLILAGLGLYFFLIPELNKSQPNIKNISNILGLIMYITCICGHGLYVNIFTSQPLIKEKSQGIIESLLATPLGAKEIWLAKSLSVFIPSLIIGEILALFYFISINLLYITPKIGFLITPWIAINSFIVVPLLYSGIILLVYLIGLIGDPVSGNVIAQIFFPVICAIVINLGIRHILETTTWYFTLFNAVIFFLFTFIVIILQPNITKENIILSVKK